MTDLNPELRSAEKWTNTSVSFLKKMGKRALWRDGHQCGETRGGRDKMKLKIDIRIQDIPQAAHEQEDEWKRKITKFSASGQVIWSGVHQSKICRKVARAIPSVKNQRNTFTNLGNVEYFELWEILSKTQCSCCSNYWTEGIVHSMCGICLTFCFWSSSRENHAQREQRQARGHLRRCKQKG